MNTNRQTVIPAIQIEAGEVSISLRNPDSGLWLKLEHRLRHPDEAECNLTYMVTTAGEFKAWRYALLQEEGAYATEWQNSPALSAFVHNATMNAAQLSFASRLSLLPQLVANQYTLTPGDIQDLEKKLRDAGKARENAEKAYQNALLGEAAAALWVYVARGKGGAYKEGIALVLAYLNAKDKQRSLDLADEAFKELQRRLALATGSSGGSGSSTDSSGGTGGGSSGGSSGGGSGSSGSGSGSGSGSSGDSGKPEHESHEDDCKLYEDSQSSTLICHDDMPNPEADPDHSPVGPRSYSGVSSAFQDRFYPNPDDTGPTGPRTFGWSLVASGPVEGNLLEPFQISAVIPGNRR
jgi:hypothetical protein